MPLAHLSTDEVLFIIARFSPFFQIVIPYFILPSFRPFLFSHCFIYIGQLMKALNKNIVFSSLMVWGLYPSSVASIISEPIAWILFKLWVFVSPGPYAGPIFEVLKKKKNIFFYEYFSFSLTWDPMGAKISKRYSSSSYKSQLKAFTLFLNFLPNGPHKNTFGIFEILSF